MGPTRIHILVYLVLIASYRKSQARSVQKGLALRNSLPKLSSKLQKDNTLAGTTSCVQLGLRNMICVYNQGRLTDLPLYDDHQFSEEQFNIWTDFEEQSHEPEAFVDLTRVDDVHNVARSHYDIDGSFSEDYLDVGDLSFTRKVDTRDLFIPRGYSELIIFLASPLRNRHISRRIFDFSEPGLLNYLSHKLTSNNDDDTNMRENTSAEEDSSEENDSSPKRFGVVDQSESSEESEEPKKVPKRVQGRQKAKKGEGSYVYMQGPTRFLGPDRRRLPHFLPKQHHWNVEDIHKLPYLWFHGPQGKFTGIYRKPI